MDEINKYWEKTKEWYDNIEISNDLFPHAKFTNKKRNKFISNLNKLLKKVTQTKYNKKETQTKYDKKEIKTKNDNIIEYIEEIIESNIKTDISNIEYNFNSYSLF